jgi:hypothetical protein
MEISETILCPYCGQRMELVVDTSVASQRFTTDCEPGEILGLDVLSGG